MNFTLRASGPEPCHLSTEIAYRFLKGEDRQNMQKSLMNQNVAKLRRQLLTKGDEQKLKVGNYNEIKTKYILQKARDEVSDQIVSHCFQKNL